MGQLWLFGGKGGVGKTTSACATAIWAANCGLSTLLVSSDPAHSTSDSLGVSLGSQPTPVEGVEGLHGMELDLAASLESIMPAMADAIRSSGSGMLPLNAEELSELKDDVANIDSSELLLPGLDEALAFDQLLRQVEDTRFDLIVFDTAPTGHTLRFLALPELLETWSARIAKLLRAMGGMRSVVFGGKQEKTIREELEKFQHRVQHIRRVLRDVELTRFTMVTIPESMAVSESERAAKTLAEFEIAINGVIINRLTPELDHPFLQKRRSHELERVDELKGIFDDLPLVTVPLQPVDVRGISALIELGELLHGPPHEFPHDMHPHRISTHLPVKLRRSRSVVEREDHTLIELHLAGSRRPELGLRGEGNRLYIAVNGRENRIDLGHAVDPTTTRAKMTGEILKVKVLRPLDSN